MTAFTNPDPIARLTEAGMLTQAARLKRSTVPC